MAPEERLGPPGDGGVRQVGVLVGPSFASDHAVEHVAHGGAGILVTQSGDEGCRVPGEAPGGDSAAPVVFLLPGGLHPGDHPAVLAHLGREQLGQGERGVSDRCAPHRRSDGRLRRSDGHARCHQLVVMGGVLVLVGGGAGTVLLCGREETVPPGL